MRLFMHLPEAFVFGELVILFVLILNIFSLLGDRKKIWIITMELHHNDKLIRCRNNMYIV